MVTGVADSSAPLLGEVTTTVSTTNAQPAKVDTITDNATTVTTNAAALMSLFSATTGGAAAGEAAAFRSLTSPSDPTCETRTEIRARRPADRSTDR
jgi:hypothetical protein